MSPPKSSTDVAADAEYHQIKTHVAIAPIAPRGQIAVSGGDRAGFLQGLLTNDIAALVPGTGCYAAWLTPQGRMLTDLHVLAAEDTIVLDVPASLVEPTLERLDRFLFSEDVQLADLTRDLRGVWLHGPQSAVILESVLATTGLAALGEYEHRRLSFGPAPALAARITQLDVPGYCVYVETSGADAFIRALGEHGVSTAGAPAVDAARIESGYPVFGIDMTDDTIPLEAGIEERAISFTKGCYVGQEVIIRVLHRGHGRVARRLVGLDVRGGVPAPGAKLFQDAREIGFVTSAADSPTRGPIALGYVHRDFVAAGTAVEVDHGDNRLSALVTSRPLPATA